MLKHEPLLIADATESPRPARKRRNGLPEHSTYVDTGCELASSCLECPLPRCKYDDPRWRRSHDLKARDARIIQLRQAGYTVKQIAAHIGVSDRTTYRVLLRDKRGEGKTETVEFTVHEEPEESSAVMSLEALEEWRPVSGYTPGEPPAFHIAS